MLCYLQQYIPDDLKHVIKEYNESTKSQWVHSKPEIKAL